MKFIDYYEVLGVPKTATEKEIKTVYRRLAKEHHPDLHQGDAKKGAEEKFKLISEAYEVLGDPEKRAKYDQLGSNWQGGQDFQPPPDMSGFRYQQVNLDDLSDFSDFFSTLFGQNVSGPRGRTRQAYQQDPFGQREFRGATVEAEISLTVEDLMNGAEKEIQIDTGHSLRTVKVKIPPKSFPGTILRLKGLGGRGMGGQAQAGDLLLHVQVLPHSIWRIVDQFDLEGDLTIYPEQAVLGDKVSVPTPDGMIQVKIKPGIRSGQKLRLKDRGFKRKNGTVGDLFIKIRIDLPAHQTDAEVELYKKIFELRNP
ncbi:MAG: DnaJ C-terminal domain-containing protein [Negativicutes bacterium]|nr:DnaJ C-terminal domain-containing protein [Negativicutes bacterium]MDR3591186.1 DnaJ C-terminal domain-containing protein [Negativicutes bacterium]